jgi:hypothetical protein
MAYRRIRSPAVAVPKTLGCVPDTDGRPTRAPFVRHPGHAPGRRRQMPVAGKGAPLFVTSEARAKAFAA